MQALVHPRLPAALYGAMALFYALAAWLEWPLLRFSVDSWSYYELARSFAGDAPYVPVLVRSFWSLEHSAAFPPGFPYLLHLLYQVFGTSPFVGFWVSLGAALLTPMLAARLARTLELPVSAGLLAGVVLLACPIYLDEALSARTIPLAIDLVLASLVLLLERRTAWHALAGGALLGFACLVRFDQLALLVLTLAWAAWRGLSWRHLTLAALAALVAMSPWMIMSREFFGTWWASDNSWVALSSTQATVLQFPAVSANTLFTDPAGFAWKCLRNVVRMGYHGASLALTAARHFGLLIVLWAAWRWRQGGVTASAPWRHRGLIAVSVLALAPQVATGYTDLRYFSLTILVVSLLCFADLIHEDARSRAPGLIVVGVAVLALMMSAHWSWRRAHDTSVAERHELESQLQAVLSRCHAREPQVRYLFPRRYASNPARYAAELGRRSAVEPWGFEQFDLEKRQALEATLQPMRYVRPLDAEHPVLSCENLLGERRP